MNKLGEFWYRMTSEYLMIYHPADSEQAGRVEVVDLSHAPFQNHGEYMRSSIAYDCPSIEEFKEFVPLKKYILEKYSFKMPSEIYDQFFDMANGQSKSMKKSDIDKIGDFWYRLTPDHLMILHPADPEQPALVEVIELSQAPFQDRKEYITNTTAYRYCSVEKFKDFVPLEKDRVLGFAFSMPPEISRQFFDISNGNAK